MNKNNKVDIEEIKNYLLEQIKINNSDIDRNIEKIRKENSVENLKNALQYFKKLVDSFGSYIYIYIKDNNVEEKFNKEKIWNKAKNWIKTSLTINFWHLFTMTCLKISYIQRKVTILLKDYSFIF
ncbi:hypothetical protein [Mesomycoplasma hyorhinis]|uniref:hypothetical protein n=2 Tax=Mesomycoplasma hyorhinis TaxID=2100 RepID=UPI001F44AE05|nr:hypothetical protein [Mesomycoplasma hyorhinis]